MTESNSAPLKAAAALRAMDFVHSGMKLGLGTGSTAEAFLQVLARRVKGGLSIVGAATSERTAIAARNLGIPIASLEQLAPLDIVIDGADEADLDFNLIKGGGGALLREKIVANASRRMVVVMDSSKLVTRLGRFPLPVEVSEFGSGITASNIKTLLATFGYPSAKPLLRRAPDGVYKTDSGNVIYDFELAAIPEPGKLGAALKALIGVVEHGIFTGLASTLIVAHSPEQVEILGSKPNGGI
jgi:ribose 5-phosphate isomerase A